MIRAGRLGDVDRAVALLRDSRAGAGFDNPAGISGFTFPFDAAYAARLFTAHIDHPDRYCAVLEIGGRVEGLLLAAAFEHPFGPVRVAKETVWWIDPAHRGRSAVAMLDHYEAWARDRAAFVGMAGMGDDPEVGKLYRRRGYKVAETCYLKAS